MMVKKMNLDLMAQVLKPQFKSFRSGIRAHKINIKPLEFLIRARTIKTRSRGVAIRAYKVKTGFLKLVVRARK